MASHPLDRFGDLPLEAQYTIDRLCTQFEDALRAGQAPSLETYLQKAPSSHQSALFTELLSLELEYRRHKGERPLEREYSQRFPIHLGEVEDVFADPVVGIVCANDPSTLHRQDASGTVVDPPAVLPTVPGYEVLSELGRGGMGVVYKARQVALNRLVALKMIRGPSLASLEEQIRFRLEAQAVAELHHPNIVGVYESGEVQGHPYVAFELVEGGSLAHLVGQPHPPAACASLVETLARAVHHAHSRGIIHRDLKPANVLLQEEITRRDAESAEKAEEERREKETSSVSSSSATSATLRELSSFVPKIADFGLAKRLQGDSWQTLPGYALGTPSYMAPEQIDVGRSPIGPACDVYSLGVILYQLLTGQVPLEGKDSTETLMLVQLREPVPPRRLRPDLPRDLEIICLKCLEKDPANRYPDAGVLADDLARWRRGDPITARPAGTIERAWKWTCRHPALAALLAAVVLLLLAVTTISSVAAVLLLHQRNEVIAQRERTRQAELDRQFEITRSLLIATPDSVGSMLAILEPAADFAVPYLREQFDRPDQDPVCRLRAAVGLTVLGQPQLAFLLDAVARAPAAESRNLALAFRSANGAKVIEQLRRRAEKATTAVERARFAILLLDLGDGQVAESLLALSANPTARSTFIDEFASWHGDLVALLGLLRGSPDGPCRSGLCAALGRVDPATLSADTRADLKKVLAELYQESPDAATHSAAGWALRQWRCLPALNSVPQPTKGRGWFVNRTGMTMLAIPPGAIEPEPDRVVLLTRPFFLSDREVSVGLFRQFVNDPKWPAADKPAGWPGPIKTISPEDNCPVNNLTRQAVLQFCNWLSAQEGRKPCYRPSLTPGGWVCDFDADGYRLPTEAEWEYALRAKATTRFFFGDDPRLLPFYAQISSLRTAICGSKQPNAFGLFDMVGNLWEICWDHDGPVSTGLKVDPTGPAQGSTWVARGGAYDSGSYDTWSGFRFINAGPSVSTGFRVACGVPGRSATKALTQDIQGEIKACTLALESLPDSVFLLRMRSDRLAQSARWSEAASDRLRVLQQVPNSHSDAYALAALLAMARDETNYRRHCRWMLKRYRETRNPRIAEQTAKACLLLAGPEEDRRQAEKLSELALNVGEEAWLLPYSELARGMAEYRAGKYPSALSFFRRCQSVAVLSKEARAAAGFFEAMTCWRLEQPEQAREAFTKAHRLVATDLKAVQQGKLGSNWLDGLFAVIAHREAEELLGRPE